MAHVWQNQISKVSLPLLIQLLIVCIAMSGTKIDYPFTLLRFLVESLVRSHHYKFRVRAVNQEGSSGHLEMKQTVQAKTPSHPSEAKQKPSGSPSQKAKEEPSSAPHFTFKLRNRLIMPGVNCKFTCHVAGKPLPNVRIP